MYHLPVKLQIGSDELQFSVQYKIDADEIVVERIHGPDNKDVPDWAFAGLESQIQEEYQDELHEATGRRYGR